MFVCSNYNKLYKMGILHVKMHINRGIMVTEYLQYTFVCSFFEIKRTTCIHVCRFQQKLYTVRFIFALAHLQTNFPHLKFVQNGCIPIKKKH